MEFETTSLQVICWGSEILLIGLLNFGKTIVCPFVEQQFSKRMFDVDGREISACLLVYRQRWSRLSRCQVQRKSSHVFDHLFFGDKYFRIRSKKHKKALRRDEYGSSLVTVHPDR